MNPFWLGLLLGLIGSEIVVAADKTTRPNILLIITDDQRPDTIGALGQPQCRTPHLDRLVRGGTAFTRATCANPHCVPSRAEILTGASGFRNGVPTSSGRLRPGLTFLGEALRQAGYHTWYSGKWMNDGSPKTRGYEETSALFSAGGSGNQPLTHPTDYKGGSITGYRGWTFKTDDGKAELDKGVGLTVDSSRHIAEGAIRLIQRPLTKPFFLHVNFTAPHDPLLLSPQAAAQLAPDQVELPKNFLPRHPFDHGNLEGRDEQLLPWPRTPEAVRREIAAYRAVIEEMDAQIGRMLGALRESGKLEQTLIIFSSDHGLALGSHGLMGKQNMYEHTIGVPLVFRGPGIPRGERRSAQCYLRDLFPTLCEVAGAAVPASVQGRSLWPVLRGQQTEVHPFIIGHYTDTQRMIRQDQWKLIYYPHLRKQQLFDLASDPNELTDLSTAPQHAARVNAMKRQLADWLQQHGDNVSWD